MHFAPACSASQSWAIWAQQKEPTHLPVLDLFLSLIMDMWCYNLQRLGCRGSEEQECGVCVIQLCSLISLSSRQQEQKCKVTHGENFPFRFECIRMEVVQGQGMNSPPELRGCTVLGRRMQILLSIETWAGGVGKVGHYTTACGSLTSAPHEVWQTYFFLIYNQFCYFSMKAQVYQGIWGLFAHFRTFVIFCLKYCA